MIAKMCLDILENVNYYKVNACTFLYEFNDGQHLILPSLEIKIPLKNEDLE